MTLRTRFSSCVLALLCGMGVSQAWGRHPYDPADPRPDLFPHTITNNWFSYRKIYNRPRPVVGYLAWKVEPTSQEAMAWQENYCAGNYASDCPTPIRHYLYPKPWEVLETGARHDPYATEARTLGPAPSAAPQGKSETDSPKQGPVEPARPQPEAKPSSEPSPSDIDATRRALLRSSRRQVQ